MKRAEYLPQIDVLRAVAVLAVLLYHLESRFLPGGFAGVDVFFVVSGFIVSKSAATRSNLSLRDFLLDFFARRIRRILPALTVCLVVTAVATALWIPPSWLSDNIPRTGRYAFFGASNIVLSDRSDRYFSPLSQFNPFTHTWSLGVEEQFYLLFPLMFFSWMCGRRGRIICASAFAVGAIASFICAIATNTDEGADGYYLFSARYWELAAGVLLYLARSSRMGRFIPEKVASSPVRIVMAASALAMLAWTFLFLKPETSPGYGPVIPVLAAILFLIAVPDRGSVGGGWGAGIAAAPLVRIGQLSYSLYLWHWPVFVLFKWTVGLTGAWSRAAALILSFALAWVSWNIVERPWRSVAAGRKKTIVVALVVVVAGSVAVRVTERYQSDFSFSTVARSRDEWYPSRGQKLTDREGCRVAPERFLLEEGWRATYRRSACRKGVSAPRIFAIGDSHALAYGPAFASYALNTGAEVTVYNNGGCPFLSLQPWREDNETCKAHASVALNDLLPKLGPRDVVFLPSLRLPRFVDQWGGDVHQGVEAQQTAGALTRHGLAVTAAAKTIERLRSTGARVILQAPGPVLKAPAFRCVDWWTKSNEICAGGASIDRAEFLSLRAPVLYWLEDLAKDDEGVTIFDPADALCPAGLACSAFLDGKPLFFDGDHISAYGNQVLLPALTEAVKRAVGWEDPAI